MGTNKISADNKALVESIIDSMVQNSLSAKDAVNAILETGTEPASEDGLVTFEEGQEVTCPNCGSTDLEEGFVESQDGEKLSALRCRDCDTGLVESQEDAQPELMEAEIDENDPKCPACGSDDLDSAMVESEDGQDLMIECRSCHTKMLVAD